MRELTAALLARAARLRPQQRWREVTLLLVDDVRCSSINAAALGHEGATDVISMTYEAIPGESSGDSAELVLNLERAWQLGRTPAGASSELALYLAHGCDHLCGFDDATSVARRSMRRREQRWLRDLAIPLLFTERAARASRPPRGRHPSPALQSGGEGGGTRDALQEPGKRA